MIARIPFQLPLFDRPFAVLLGEPLGVSEWYMKAARELEPVFDSVVIADGASDGGDQLYVHVLHACLDQMLVALIYGGGQWLEVGRLIQRCPDKLVVGMPPDRPWDLGGHLKYLFELEGGRVWDNLDDAITATRRRRMG